MVGGKLVGAGGGGFLLVYSERPNATREAMAGAGAQELRFEFEFQGCVGSRVWPVSSLRVGIIGAGLIGFKRAGRSELTR